MLLDEIKVRLAAMTPSVGHIEKGEMPTEPDECVSLQEYGGPPSEAGFGVEGVKRETPGLHVEVRGTPRDYQAPRAVIGRIRNELAKVQAKELSGVLYLMIRPVQSSPIKFDPDESGRITFAWNFLCEKDPS